MATPPQLTPELAARLHRALVADSDELFQIVLDPAPEVLRAMLKNRQLSDAHLLALLKRHDLPADLAKAIWQSEHCTASHAIKVALARNPATPGTVVLALLPHLRLFELLEICLLAGPTPDQKLAAERGIIQRLPTTPLGNKITLARRGTPTLLGELLKGNEAVVIDACLDNPKLRELSLIQYINSAYAKGDVIGRIAGHPRWRANPNLRLMMLKSPHTPCAWYINLLPPTPLHEVRNLLHSPHLTRAQKKLIEDEIQRRTPSGKPGPRRPA